MKLLWVLLIFTPLIESFPLFVMFRSYRLSRLDPVTGEEWPESFNQTANTVYSNSANVQAISLTPWGNLMYANPSGIFTVDPDSGSTELWFDDSSNVLAGVVGTLISVEVSEIHCHCHFLTPSRTSC